MTFENICKTLNECFAMQVQDVTDWHVSEIRYENDDTADLHGLDGLRELVRRQHWCNFTLWHVEDRARRKDVAPEVIADCKYAIDGLNQRRNDYMEKIDRCIVEMVYPMLPEGGQERYNTETIGMSVDRMSIMSLKLFHMEEQKDRTDVDDNHVAECGKKCMVITEQRADLETSILQLLEEYKEGTKRPKVYYQFKMYNDPSLNPELYDGK
ncbi:MAG: DUF4254 domain-containing protein [Desulfovibrio sp.]